MGEQSAAVEPYSQRSNDLLSFDFIDNPDHENKLNQVKEMFAGTLDPDVVQMVMSESNYNVEAALETLMMLSEEGLGLDDYGPNLDREAPVLLEEIPLTERTEVWERETPSSSQGNEVCGIIRENNRISFIDVYSNEIYRSNEDLYNGGATSAPTNEPNSSPDSEPSAPPPKETNKMPPRAPQKKPQNSNRRPDNKYWEGRKQMAVNLIKAGQPVLVILRGVPGSGKSTLAREISQSAGIVVSTDDFFMRKIKKKMVYDFNPNLLGEAHEWNQKRTEKLMSMAKRPIIVDNTNIMIWEMKPYIGFGLKFGYSIHILEPTLPWKFDPRVLAQKNSHHVPRKIIENMLNKFECRSPEIIIGECLKEFNQLNHGKIRPLMAKEEMKVVTKEVPKFRKKLAKDPKKPEKKKGRGLGEVSQKPELAKDQPNKRGISIDSGKELFLLNLAQKPPVVEARLAANGAGVNNGGLEHKNPDIIASNSPKKHNPQKTEAVLAKEDFIGMSLQDLMAFSNQESDSPKSSPRDPDLDNWEAVTGEDFSGLIQPSQPALSSNWDLISLSETAAQPPQPGARMKKNKLSPNFSVPLIDFQTKSKLTKENWVVPQFPSPKVIEVKLPDDLPKVYRETGTGTTIEDFVTLYKVQNNMTCKSQDFSVKLSSQSLTPVVDHATSLIPNVRNPAVLMLDKSTMTDEAPLATFEDAIKYLRSMFPSIPLADLTDILEKCHGDQTWAVNILLDSGTEFAYDSLPPDLKNTAPKVVDGGGDLPSSSTTSSVDAPSSSSTTPSVEASSSERTTPNVEVPLAKSQTVVMNLEQSFASKLIKLFGPAHTFSSIEGFSKERMQIEIPIEIAEQFHSIWSQKLESLGPIANPVTKKKNRKKKTATETAVVAYVPPVDSQETSFKEIMDYEKAIEISQEELRRNQKPDMSVDFKRSYLFQLYPSIDELALNDLFESNGYSLEKTINALKLAIGDDIKEYQEATRVEVEKCDEQFREFSVTEVTSQSTYQELREKANSHHELRSHYMQQAIKARSNGMSSTASYYIEQGMQQLNKMKDISKLACSAVINERNSGRQHNELDLHGLHVDEAISAVQKFISMKKQLLRQTNDFSVDLYLITGRGNHSKDGIPKIKMAVMNFLKSSKFSFINENSGMIKVILTKK